jgi:hypothetical protein
MPARLVAAVAEKRWTGVFADIVGATANLLVE